MATALEESPLRILNETSWPGLLSRIHSNRCTPILGPELCFGDHTRRASFAQTWAGESFLFRDSHDLSRVAQFVAMKHDRGHAKLSYSELLAAIPVPNFDEPNDPYRILAGLPFSVYVTTNHDDFLIRAMNRRVEVDKKPRREISHWYEDQAGLNDFAPSDAIVKPEIAMPVVFHLYGHIGEPDSLVLTEDDHLDFLAAQVEEKRIVPPHVAAAFKTHALLLLGYRLSDLDFRVLLRLLERYKSRNVERRHVSVQIVAERDSAVDAADKLAQVQDLLGEYCVRRDIEVYWGSSRQFLAELQRRWKGYSNGK